MPPKRNKQNLKPSLATTSFVESKDGHFGDESSTLSKCKITNLPSLVEENNNNKVSFASSSLEEKTSSKFKRKRKSNDGGEDSTDEDNNDENGIEDVSSREDEELGCEDEQTCEEDQYEIENINNDISESTGECSTSSDVMLKSTVDNSNMIFCIEFSTGYIFRQFVEFSKRVSKELPLAISRKGISTAYCSSSRQMIVNAVIRSEDLTKFYINKNKVNIPSDEKFIQNEWTHIINVDAIELFEHVRTVAKKDGIRIMQKINKPEILQIQIYGNKTDGGISNIRLKKYTPISYNINEVNRRPTTCPNVTIQLSKFCNCLLGLVKARYVKINMKIYGEGVVIVGTSSSETASRGSTFGNISSSGEINQQSSSSSNPQQQYHQLSLSSQTVSALTKMINFNNEGVVRVYSSSNGFARIESHLGCFGVVRVYLIDKTIISSHK